LEAFVLEFTAADNVALWLQTYLYGDMDPHNQKRIEDKVETLLSNIAEKHNLTFDDFPRIEVLSKELSSQDMPRLYKNFDCFVLATRGEGWGLPIIEAMAMEIPVIVTNWSGPTEFVTEENGFLVSAVAEPVRAKSKENWAKVSY
jgi:glycosyltransferase involved in cell wall biosynthesis